MSLAEGWLIYMHGTSCKINQVILVLTVEGLYHLLRAYCKSYTSQMQDYCFLLAEMIGFGLTYLAQYWCSIDSWSKASRFSKCYTFFDFFSYTSKRNSISIVTQAKETLGPHAVMLLWALEKLYICFLDPIKGLGWHITS